MANQHERVLVTGTSGHVGGAVAQHLIALGYEVYGLSRRPSNIEGLAGQVQVKIGSPEIVDQLNAELPACAAIVHAAACIDHSLYVEAVSLTNCLGTQQVLKLASWWKTQSFVYISGVPVIGQKPSSIPVMEDHPTCPPTAYHAAKLYGEYLVRIAAQKDLAGVSLRLTSPVGPGMPSDRILSVFVRNALYNNSLIIAGQGTRRQNYIDVRDVALAVNSCIQQRVTGLFNVASPNTISNYELALTCVRVLGSSSDIQFSEYPDPQEGVVWDVSIAHALEALGFQPQYDIVSSILAVAADYADSNHQ